MHTAQQQASMYFFGTICAPAAAPEVERMICFCLDVNSSLAGRAAYSGYLERQ
jgi:hypothetical protein